MKIMKASELVEYFKKAADFDNPEKVYYDNKSSYAGKNHWGYIYGSNGEIWDEQVAKKYSKKPPNGKMEYYLNEISKSWFGRKVVDCSGLIIEALRTKDPKYADQCADNMCEKATKSGDMATMPEVPGILLWHKGHIGIYIGNGLVIEAKQQSAGVVVSKANARGFKKWGYLKDVDYSEAE